MVSTTTSPSMDSMACRNSPGLVPEVDTPSPTRLMTSSRPSWPSGYTVPPMITDMGTTMIPSFCTRPGGIDAALSVTTVTVKLPASLRRSVAETSLHRGALPAFAGQGHGCGHMGEVADALGEVAEQGPVPGVDLLGEQAQIVRCA